MTSYDEAMFYYSARVFTARTGGNRNCKFSCRCGYAGRAAVYTEGTGRASAHYGIGAERAEMRARELAEQGAEEAAQRAVALSVCPACQTRDARKLRWARVRAGAQAFVFIPIFFVTSTLAFVAAMNMVKGAGSAAFFCSTISSALVSAALTAWHVRRTWRRVLAESLAVQFIDTRQWSLPSGQRVLAGFDRSSGQESVWCDKMLVSRARLGTKAEGHALPVAVAGGDPYRAGARVAVVFFQRDGVPFLELAGERIAPLGAEPAAVDASASFSARPPLHEGSAPAQLVASAPTHRPCGRVEPTATALDEPRRSAPPRAARRGGPQARP